MNPVPNSNLFLIAILVGLFAGGLLGAQPSVNGFLGQHLRHPLQAALISFGSGTAVLFLLCVAAGQFPPNFTITPQNLPWWSWFGGLIGVILVTTSLILVPRVGSLPWFAAVMTGQTIAALFLDHFGMLGNPRTSISPLRMIGASLLIAGVLFIVYAKHAERQESTVHPTSIDSDQESVGNHR